ncbi:hypothetical protein [Nocardiopsis baichengensis]|uniref:hypothetical protein n=1 Tax=Nocardiopsis baichengensis TaxID=280240 RepID=UPI0003455949|nr:hypothetical protein [Nocardiopsis baichengensis]
MPLPEKPDMNQVVTIKRGDLRLFQQHVNSVAAADDPTTAACEAAYMLAPLAASDRLPRRAVIWALYATAVYRGADPEHVAARVMARINAAAN